jgi:bifunctional UDP-N-acetylglucosamine pyrophosphorylase / glucosamine-1-phosphate N-acetyltransferase
MPNTVACVLAAGKGTRMKSRMPKVLHGFGGRTLVGHVLHALQKTEVNQVQVVIGHGAEAVEANLSGQGVGIIYQHDQKGTGHAVQQVAPALQNFTGTLLVVNGDMPLITPQTIQQLLDRHHSEGAKASLVTARLADPTGYGRVFLKSDGSIERIIEHRDCTPEERLHPLVNAGVYCFDWQTLWPILKNLSNNNDQGEYYLTDVIAQLAPAFALEIEDEREILGVNNRLQLAEVAEIYYQRILQHWMLEGVTILDPRSTTIEDTVQLEPDVVIEPQTHLRGTTVIRSGASLGPNSLIVDSEIGAESVVRYSVIERSRTGSQCAIGPYSHIRDGAVIGDHCRIGNFVEIKKSTLGNHTNSSHLSYLGDATLGERVNIGAGTITANYDGFRKNPTIIGNGTKTGSNSVLIAPITLGENVNVGAGSVVTKDVPDGALVVARAKQVVKENWKPKNLIPPSPPSL